MVEQVRCGGRIFEDRAPFSAYHCRCGAKPKAEDKIRGFWGLLPTSALFTEHQDRTTKSLLYKMR